MNKKVLMVFISIVSVFFFFSCSAKKKEKTPVVTVAWWGDGYNKLFIDRLKAVYEKENPGVKILPRDIAPKNYEGQILRLASANDLPDVILSGVNSYYGFSRRGLFEDLTEFVGKEENKEMIDNIVDVSLEASYVKGKIYGLPIWDNVFAVFYNKEILRREGVELPESISWSDFYNLLKKVTVPGKRFGLVGQLDGSFLNWGLWMKINQFGRDVLSEDGKQIHLKNDETHKTFKFFKKLHDEKITAYGQELDNMQGTVGTFQSGNAVFQTSGRWGYDSLVADSGVDFGVMRYPHEKQKYMVNSPMWLCLSRDVKNREEAEKFIKYIASPEGQKFVYKMRTDISIQKPILMSKEFLNSKGHPEYDKEFRRALLNSKFNRFNTIPGVFEWDRKYSTGFVSTYYVGDSTFDDLVSRMEEGWKNEVAPLVD